MESQKEKEKEILKKCNQKNRKKKRTKENEVPFYCDSFSTGLTTQTMMANFKKRFHYREQKLPDYLQNVKPTLNTRKCSAPLAKKQLGRFVRNNSSSSALHMKTTVKK